MPCFFFISVSWVCLLSVILAFPSINTNFGFELVFYGDLVYKCKRVGKFNFSDQFKKITKRYKKVCMSGYKPNHGL